MKGEERQALEDKIQEHHAAEAYGESARVALEGYGPEILGFLMALTRDPETASEVFSQFSEDLWKGLPGFRWGSSFRTWAYTIARNAYRRYLRDPHFRRGTRLETSELYQLQQKVRTSTMPFLLTSIKDRFAALRESLSPDDQTLLILRVDRRMNWKEIAEVMLDGEDEESESERLTDKEIRRKAASLRKRFERVKAKLKELAEDEGLFEG